jgi:hypothetical protein
MATQRFKTLTIMVIKIYIKTHKTNLIVLYGSEKWAMTGQIKSFLKTYEQKILQKTYGPAKDQNGWTAGYVEKTKHCDNNKCMKIRIGWSSGKNF